MDRRLDFGNRDPRPLPARCRDHLDHWQEVPVVAPNTTRAEDADEPPQERHHVHISVRFRGAQCWSILGALDYRKRTTTWQSPAGGRAYGAEGIQLRSR